MSDFWQYRVVRKKLPTEDGHEDWYSVQEVYFDEEGTPMAQSIDLDVNGRNLQELTQQLEGMTNCLKLPIINYEDIINETEELCEQ
tara:strand:- start:161 stop:418 length:258 start_codon:yes stop_codon:yes gene_type:complete